MDNSDCVPPEHLLFLPEKLVSPYLTRPKTGTWRYLPTGEWLHEPTGSVWPDDTCRVLNDESVNILNAEIVVDDILDAEVIG